MIRENVLDLTIEQALRQGVAAHKAGKLEDAERFYRAILQSHPKHPDANHNLGVLAVSVNKVDAALPLFKTALEANPKIEQFWLSYIDALIKEKQFENAKQVIEQGKKLGLVGDKVNIFERELGVSVVNIAYIESGSDELAPAIKFREAGKFEEAKKWLQNFIESQPNHPEGYKHLGNTLLALDRLSEAEAIYRQAIALQPGYASVHSNLGITLKKLGRLDEAEACFAQAIALTPDSPEAHYNRGNMLKELDRLDEAEASFTQAIALKPNFADALANRSLLLLDKREYEAALRDADTCILSKKTRALPLISLYALGRVSEIYERLEIQSKDDAENISIAAFAAFFSNVEGKPTANNFCPNPIDFIHIANLSSHVNDSVEYIGDIIEELHKIETIWEPPGKATVSGFQSPNNMNLFSNPSGKIAQLKSIIITELEAYYLKFQSEQCSYIKKFPTTRNLIGWNVILKQLGHQSAHIHPGGWLSGVIYLKLIPSLGKDEGAIEFTLDGEHYYDVNSRKLTFQPEVGDMVFFPSSLHHKTIPFTTDADRISVSFDLMPQPLSPNQQIS